MSESFTILEYLGFKVDFETVPVHKNSCVMGISVSNTDFDKILIPDLFLLLLNSYPKIFFLQFLV